MKAILLFTCALAGLFFSGCESELPPDPNHPTVAFGNDKFREDGNEHRMGPAIDRDKNLYP